MLWRLNVGIVMLIKNKFVIKIKEPVVELDEPIVEIIKSKRGRKPKLVVA